MKRLWFKAKTYGYGWYPATWEGWSVLLGYVVLFAGGDRVFINVVGSGNAGYATVAFVIYVLAITAGLCAVAAKTGEKACWRWGRPK